MKKLSEKKIMLIYICICVILVLLPELGIAVNVVVRYVLYAGFGVAGLSLLAVNILSEKKRK